MIDKIIKGIKYLLDEENLTAEVIHKKGYEGDIIIPETVVSKKVAYRVTSIEKSAFDNCKSLIDITFQGTIAQWKKITLRDSWKHNIPATVVHCTDGDVEI